MNRQSLQRYPVVVPEDLPNGAATRSVARACAAVYLGEIHGRNAESIVKGTWPDDNTALFLTRAAVSPTTTTSAPAIAPPITASFLRATAPSSAAARLFERSLQLDFNGVYKFTFPYASSV